MSELVIVGISSVIAAALTLMICKLIVSYIDKRNKKIKYHNEQYKKVEMNKAYSWFLQHMLEFIEIENLNVGHHITINNEKMWEKFKKAMEE
jgi:low temperature requirement protein LtrA